MKRIAVTFLALLLCGCQSKMVKDQMACEGYGFVRGTDGFANCMLQLESNRQAALRDMQDTLKDMQDSNAAHAEKQRAILDSVAKPKEETRCTSRRVGDEVQTVCE